MDTNKLLSLQTLEDIKNYIDGNMGAFKVYQIDIPAPLASGRGSDISGYGIQVTRALNECIAIGKLPVIKSKNYYGLIFPDFTIETLRDITYTKYEFVSPLCIVKSTSNEATRIGVANIYFKFAAHDETGLTYKSDMSGAGQCWWHSTHTTAVLPINNEYKFTPTKDYHPATKKYVDEAVTAILNRGEPVTYIEDNSLSNPFILEEHAPGVYVFNNTPCIIARKTNGSHSALLYPAMDNTICLLKTPLAEDPVGTVVASYTDIYLRPGRLKLSSAYVTGLDVEFCDTRKEFVTKGGKETISGEKTFRYLPKLEAEKIPTSNLEFVTKKYVDDTVAASAGSGSSFDPTKYLAIDNTTEYTPTSNYHPATKKYVDDNKVSSNEITAILDEYGTKQNLKVGDDLTGKTISYSFPNNIEDNIAEDEQIIISTSTESGDHHVILVSSNTLKYRYIDTEGSPYTRNLCTISNGATGDISYNFRFTIQDIDTSNYLYPYLFFKEDPLLSRIETLETNSAKETSKLTIQLDINGPSDWEIGTDNIEINYTNEDGRFISEKWYPTDITRLGEDKIINIAKGTIFTITSTYNMTNLRKYGECTNVQPLYKNTSSTEITCFIYKDGKVRFWDGEST